ncbi:MAG: hypothetical protein MJ232_08800, partial [archaeon]|nr:hypothetical protein [archaeon]
SFIPKNKLFDFVNSNVIKFNFDLVEFFNKFVISLSFINNTQISAKKEYVSSKLKCLMKMDYKSLNLFIKHNPEIIKDIYLRDDFIKAIANVYDPIKFRSLVLLLTDHYHVDCYEIERIKKAKLTNTLKDNITAELPNSFIRMINDIVRNPNNLVNYRDELNPSIYKGVEKIINDKDNDDEWKVASLKILLKKEFTLDLTFSIMDCLFGDFYKNVLIDVNELVKNKDLIDKTHYNFYNSVLNFVRYNNQKKIEFYFTFKDMDIKKMFYNDIRKVKNHLYKDIVDGSLKLDKKSKLYQASESKKNNIDIYRLDGEEFKAIVRCHPINKPMYISDSMRISEDTVRNTQNVDSDGYSFQMISSENLTTYVNPKEFVTLLYSNIDCNNIVHINRDDSFSSYNRLTNDYGSDYVNELSGPDELIKDSEAYCEIVVANIGDGIKPDAVVCYDRYTDYDLMLAKRLGIPILVIDTTKYKFVTPESFNEDRMKYARSAEDAFSDQTYVSKFSRK